MYHVGVAKVIIFLTSQLISRVSPSTHTVRASAFSLYKRVIHVLTEALRVLEFRKICLDATTSQSGEGVYKNLGDLMNLSQRSLKENYQASCDEIEEVVRISRENGSLGSRFTGQF